MEWNYTKPNEFKISNWSGGKTTELYIYPPSADYAKRNFIFRLSCATVTDAKSTFSDLTSYNRKLMVLSDGLILQHDDCAPIKLKKYQVDTFDGSSKTVSYGKCNDFNVMWSKKSHIAPVIDICDNEYLNVELKNPLKESFYYIISGTLFFCFDDKKVQLTEGGILHIEPSETSFHFQAHQKVQMIKVVI